MYLKNTIAQLEIKQFAESIIKIKNTRLHTEDLDTLPMIFKNRHFDESLNPALHEMADQDFEIEFDSNLNLGTIWVDYQTLLALNSLRDEVYSSVIRDQRSQQPSPEIKAKPRNGSGNNSRTSRRKVDSDELKITDREWLGDEPEPKGFCHHCKQLKSSYILAKCRYNSRRHQYATPNIQDVNGVQVYNIDPNITEFVHFLSKIKQKDSRGEARPPEPKKELCCDRLFCSFYLKTYYDQMVNKAKQQSNWTCPYCNGICNCTRCLRQDSLTKLRALYISINGDMEQLEESPSVFD